MLISSLSRTFVRIYAYNYSNTSNICQRENIYFATDYTPKFALNDAQSHSESGKKKFCPIKRSANLYFKRDVYIGHTQRIEKIFAPVDIARRTDTETVGRDAESGHTARLSRGGDITGCRRALEIRHGGGHTPAKNKYGGGLEADFYRTAFCTRARI